MTQFRSFARILLSSAAIAFCATDAHAITTVWQGTTNSDWFTISNWNNGIPGVNDTVQISSTSPNAATITNTNALSQLTLLGVSSGQTGSLTVSGAGEWYNNGDLLVGDSGNGVLNILSSGEASAGGYIYLGYGAGSDGQATVSGAGSTLSSDYDIHVGREGTGELNVNSGGAVDSAGFFVGNDAGSSGVANVSGANSTVSTLFDIIVGRSGEGEMTVSNGAKAIAGSNFFIGNQASGEGTLTVTGAGSELDNTFSLYVGNFGEGTLNILDGATSTGNNVILAGYEAGSTGTINLSGSGSTLSSVNGALIGNNGNGFVNISDQAVLTSLDVVIGYNAGSSGEVTISDNGSLWDVTGAINVGYFGGDAKLTVESGGDILTDSFNVGGMGAANAASALVTGAGSTIEVDSGSIIGFLGAGELRVEDGGKFVGGTDTYVGYIGEGTVTVAGANSLMENQTLSVGYFNTGTLTIANGGKVESGTFTLGEAGGAGTVNIGAASGAAVTAGTLDIASGAITAGTGTGIINFNHTDADYAFDYDTSGAVTVNQRAGTTRFTGTNTYSGDTNILGGRLLVDGTVSSASIISGNALLGGTGTIGNVTNSGILAPGAGLTAGTFGTLTVDGDYTGNNGSFLRFNTQLGGETSPTDTLVLRNSTVSGASQILINNVGGQGASTNGVGIRIIEASGTTIIPQGTFTLAGNVCAGIFCYSLEQGDGTMPGQYDYFLTSDFSNTQFQEVFAPVSAPAAQGQVAVTGGIDQSLLVARNVFSTYLARSSRHPVQTAAANPAVQSDVSPENWYVPAQRRHAAYITGNIGIGQGNDLDNHGYGGTVGIVTALTDDIAIGGGVLSSRSVEETNFGGESRVDATGVNVIAAYEPLDSHWRLYGSAAAAYLDVNTDRNYFNGGGLETSEGDTDGYAYGVSLRGGYEVPLSQTARVMPYAELQWSRTQLDGFTETGAGSLPATIGEQDNDRAVSRLGFELTQTVDADFETRFRAAWGHELTSGDGGVNATSLGFSQNISSSQGDRDWAEAGITGIWRASDRTTFTADLAGRAGDTGEPAVNAIIGVSVGF